MGGGVGVGGGCLPGLLLPLLAAPRALYSYLFPVGGDWRARLAHMLLLVVMLVVMVLALWRARLALVLMLVLMVDWRARLVFMLMVAGVLAASSFDLVGRPFP